jgi:hypothetical protein
MKDIAKKSSLNHLYQTIKSRKPNQHHPRNTPLNYQLLTYIVTLIEMPSNDFQYQGLGNWVHLKSMKKKIKVVTLPSKQKQNNSRKTTGIIQGEQFYIINSTL